MKSQFSKRSSLKRIAIWFVIQTPIMLYILVAASLSSWYDEPTNPLSSQSISFLKLRPNPLHDAIGFMAFCLISFALIFLCAAWKTKNEKKGASSYLAQLLTSFFYGVPTTAVAMLIGQDLLQNMDPGDYKDTLVSLIQHFANGEISNLILGGAVVLLSTMVLTWNRPKPFAMQRSCFIAGIAASFYIFFGLARLALIQIKPEWFFQAYQQHYDLIGTGIALLSVAIGLRWALGAVFANRRMKCANLCESCGYDFTGLKERCPECGSPITPQTS